MIMVSKDDYELYFLNDSYDDEIITDATASFRNRLYYDILEGKRLIQDNKIINGDISDISINKDLNKKYDMPESSYSLWLNCDIVPFYSEKDFMDKYGYENVISSNDVLNDSSIFNKSLFFFINDYLIFDIKIVVKKDECILFIPVSTETAEAEIDKGHFEELMNRDDCDNTWTLYLATKSDYYYGYSTRASLFNYNKIYISKLSSYKLYNKPVKNNNWTIYVTYEQKSKNIMISSKTNIDSDENGYYFVIDDKFKELIYAHTNVMKCLIVNEPESFGDGIYVNSDSTDPIFQIPYKKNPIPLENIIVWKYDYSTNRKLHPLQVYAELKYPNIYNFSEMTRHSYFQVLYSNSKSMVMTVNSEVIVLSDGNDTIKNYDLYIEWVEPTQDISAFDNYIQDYIDCYGDLYAEMNEKKISHPLILDYKPINHLEFTSEEYLESDFKGDYRAWKLDKLIQLLKDNPFRYEELFNKIYELRKKIISKTFTYENDPHIYDRSILDNKTHCDNSTELAMLFSIPQSYIRIYNASCSTRNCALFIDGVLKDISYIMNFGSILYIYFPKEYLNEHQDIHVDVYIDDYDQENKKVRLNKLTSEYDLEKDPFIRENSLSNILFYDYETGNYINNSDLSFELQIAISDIQYIGLNKVDTISNLNSETQLFELDKFLFVPTDFDMIILQQTDVRHLIENILSEKKIDLNNIVIKNNNPKYYDKLIGISTTNFQNSIKIKVDSTYIESNDNILYFKNFKGMPNFNRFHIYYEGLLVNPNLYSIRFSKYKGNAVVEFTDAIQYGTYVIEYTGYNEDMIYNGLYKDLNINNDSILYLDNLLDTPFDKKVHKLYIDGYRIPELYINFIGQNSMITINDPNRTISDNSNIIIFKQSMDKDPYEYDTNLQFISEVSKEDSTFKEFLLQKYK